MKRLRSHWLHALLAACALITGALVFLPQSEGAPAAPARAERYAGPDFQARPGSKLQTFALSLSAPAAVATPVNAEPLPTLVGLVGRSAYLRGASSGETERVSVGGEFEGWRLFAIGARAVTLRGPAGDRRLELFPVAAPDQAAEAAATSTEPQVVGG